MIPFFHFAYDFIANHTLGCAFVAAVFVSSLPKPGSPWTFYEIVYTFLNGIAANLPQKHTVIVKKEGNAN
jgi:hypothetical protein